TEIQLRVAKNWLEGEGMVYEWDGAGNICDTEKLPLTNMMPGYVWAVSAVYLLTGDWLWANFWLDVAAIWAILLSMRAVLLLLSPTSGLVEGVVWVFLTFSPAPFHYMASSDLLAWAFFSGMCYAFLTGTQRHNYWWLIGCCLLSLLAAVTRYAYVPLMILPVLFGSLVYRGEVLPRKTWQLLGILQIIGITGVILLKNSLTDTVNYLAQGEAAWEFSHLLWTDPFPAKTFLYMGIPHLVGISAFHPFLPYLIQFFCWIGSFWLVWVMWNHKKKSRAVNFHVWVDMGVATALAVWMMLAYASLMEVAQTWNLISFWTYVMETRYYAPAMLFVLVSLGVVLKEGRGVGKKSITVGLVALTLAYLLLFIYQRNEIYGKDKQHISFMHQDKSSILHEIEKLGLQEPQVYVLSDVGAYIYALSEGIPISTSSLVEVQDCEGVVVWYQADHVIISHEWQESFSTSQHIQLDRGKLWVKRLNR
ncbi:MAG: hypothetical protein AAF655_26980, partial [Bacteroidota bacterium]